MYVRTFASFCKRYEIFGAWLSRRQDGRHTVNLCRGLGIIRAILLSKWLPPDEFTNGLLQADVCRCCSNGGPRIGALAQIFLTLLGGRLGSHWT
ncbi:hypothetical protein NDU88_001313 [Pleurodeles waltl]|uniref:Uncharacterized protein n=1 Tax=Pleurodeles waltl TaxID=8319 RepID=A0AAV7SYW5_PLEWA|nr:hypothetical protein NDU88_001313 [Pleurodeles waltl]